MTRGKIRLDWGVTRYPAFDGFRYFVEYNTVFDVGDFCDAYGLDRSDIDDNDVASVQYAAANLAPDEWLEVTHVNNEDY